MGKKLAIQQLCVAKAKGVKPYPILLSTDEGKVESFAIICNAAKLTIQGRGRKANKVRPDIMFGLQIRSERKTKTWKGGIDLQTYLPQPKALEHTSRIQPLVKPKFLSGKEQKTLKGC